MWHVVQAMHRAEKSPKPIMETLDVTANLKAHKKGQDRLIAIAKAHAEQLRSGRDAPKGGAEKIRKKKKKKSPLPADDDQSDAMSMTIDGDKTHAQPTMSIKLEPKDDCTLRERPLSGRLNNCVNFT